MTSNCMRSLALALGAAAMAPPLWALQSKGEPACAPGLEDGHQTTGSQPLLSSGRVCLAVGKPAP